MKEWERRIDRRECSHIASLIRSYALLPLFIYPGCPSTGTRNLSKHPVSFTPSSHRLTVYHQSSKYHHAPISQNRHTMSLTPFSDQAKTTVSLRTSRLCTSSSPSAKVTDGESPKRSQQTEKRFHQTILTFSAVNSKSKTILFRLKQRISKSPNNP